MNPLRKLLKDPGVLFAAANVFAFIQSGNPLALSLALGTAVTATAVSASPRLHQAANRLPRVIMGDPNMPALRLNGIGVLAAGIIALAAGAWMPGIAGLAFATGNIMATSPRAQAIQQNLSIQGWKKVLTNPAVFYGIGYSMVGLMAGGGAALLANPLGNVPALLTTCLGITATSLSSVGLALGKFKNPAAPFMTVAFGTAINTVSGLLSGNVFGIVNNLFAMGGEVRLAQINYAGHQSRIESAKANPPQIRYSVFPANPPAHSFECGFSPDTSAKPLVGYEAKRIDRFFNFASRQLLKPLEVLDRARPTRFTGPV